MLGKGGRGGVAALICALSLVIPALPAVAAEPLAFSPAADATIFLDQPTTNAGSASKLEVDNSPVANFLLKFIVTGVGAGSVSSAKLRLYNTNGSSVGGSFYRVADTTWQESTVTWSTAPAATGSPVATLGTVSSGLWYEVDLTSAITGDGTYGFRISSTSTNGADYTSKEGSAEFRPQLLVNVGGGSADTTPPTAQITSPTSGATVSGVTPVAADASDDVGVARVEFFVDGTLRTSDTSAPYGFSWDTTATANGAHALDATAYDTSGNSGRAATVTVTVDNPASSDAVVFGGSGDLGATSNTTATLTALDGSGADFFLALGDLSYGDVGPEQAWCDYVKSKLPTLGAAFPFELLVGNHEDQAGADGYILNFAACLPDRLNVTPGPGAAYGVEYFFDYPATSPLVRVILTSPELTVEGVTYRYAKDDAHYTWVANSIDAARGAGIPWVFVGMHEPSWSAGSHGGSVDPNFANMLIQKKVDLVLQAHDHNYQRGKQLALGTGCTAVPYGSFDADCVVDDGSDGQYGRGAGTVFLINGSGGASLHSVSTTSAEAPYFAALDDTTYGFTRYTLTRDRLDARFVNSVGSFTDAFSIGGGSPPPPPPPPPSDTTPPTAPTNLTAGATGANRVDLAWTASTDNVGVAGYRVFRDGVQIATASSTSYADTTVASNTTYAYYVSAFDAAGNVSGPSNTASVTTPMVLTFNPAADAYVAADAPDANFGSAQRIEVDASPLRQTLMRFSLSGIGSGRVLGARLRLHNVDGSSRGGDFYRVADTSWQESTVTWNTAPVAAPSPFASLGKVAPGIWYEVDLSSVVSGDGTFSLKITSPSRNGAAYDSREGSASLRPQLIVTLAAA